jgi:hypothetical protein
MSSSIVQIPSSERFKSNLSTLLNFCDEIITKAYTENVSTLDPQKTIRIPMLFIHAASSQMIIEEFITYTYPLWAQIHKKNEFELLEEIKRLSAIVGSKSIEIIRELLVLKNTDGSSYISNEEREILWKYLSSLIKISLHYIHEVREPIRCINPPFQYKYANNKFSHVNNLHELVEKWGIKKL